MKGGGLNKNNNKAHFDNGKGRSQTPPRIQSRAGQFGNRRSIPRSK